jgi:hypothetical protein
VDEQDLVDEIHVLEEDGAHEAIEIAAGNEAVTLKYGGHRQTPFVSRMKMGWRSQDVVHHTAQYC